MTVTATDQRAAAIAGARRLLDVLEAHPEVPLPWHIGGCKTIDVPTTIYVNDPTTFDVTCVALGTVGAEDVTVGGPEPGTLVQRSLTTHVGGLVVAVVEVGEKIPEVAA